METTTTTPTDRDDHRPGDRRRFPARLVGTLVTALALLATQVGPVQASPSGGEEQPFTVDLFYADFDLDVLLFAGARVEAFCDEIAPNATAIVTTRRDGTVVTRARSGHQPIFLYTSPLGAPELVDATCAALADDDPTTVAPEPLATGEGRVRFRSVARPDGTVEIVNQTVGTARSESGTTYRVRGRADFELVDGVPQGDPADFQFLALRSKR